MRLTIPGRKQRGPAPVDGSIDLDRIAKLEARVTALEESDWALRDTLSKVTLKGRLYEKFRPKITRLRHYRPREFDIPDSYRQITLPRQPPTFAIVTPSYNQAKFIGATVDSVLGQGYPALNFHVQDAKSSDDTVSILKSRNGKFSWNSAADQGQANGINLGFQSLQGEIMAYLNSDDVLLPGALAYVARAFAADPTLDIVYGHRVCIDRNGLDIGRWLLPKHDREAIKWFDYIPQETMFWRRRVWDTLGGVDETFRFAIDWDFILRAHAKGMKFLRLPRFLGCFRVHDEQKTGQMCDIAEEESERLRLTHLGFIPKPKQIDHAIAGYLRRHVIYHRLYKLKLIDC
jgi:glycosyltransferase involved in cell wall biosynthesis